MNIQKDFVATIHYVLKDTEDNLLDSTEGQDPVSYIHGSGELMPALERSLEGKSVNDSFEIIISPEEGFGNRDENLLEKLEIKSFENPDQIKPGVEFQLQSDDGTVKIASVVEVSDKMVTLDMNHPLAGVTLKCKIDVLEIREATKEELEHGHVHGDGCNH